MFILDYHNLSLLLQSPYGDSAREALAAHAARQGMGPIVQRALDIMGAPSDARLFEDRLRASFAFLEELRGRPAQARTVRLFNEVSILARTRAEAEVYGRRLLEERDENGVPVVSSVGVRTHIEYALRLLEAMGSQHVAHPCCWKDLIEAAYQDLCGMGRIMLFTIPNAYEPQEKALRDFLRSVQLKILRARAMPGIEGSTRTQLEVLGDLIQAYLKRETFDPGEYGAIRQVIYEAFMLSSPAGKVFDDYAASLGASAEEARVPEVRSWECPESFTPANDSADASAAELFASCDPAVSTMSIESLPITGAFLAIHPCTPVRPM